MLSTLCWGWAEASADPGHHSLHFADAGPGVRPLLNGKHVFQLGQLLDHLIELVGLVDLEPDAAGGALIDGAAEDGQGLSGREASPAAGR